MGKSKTHFRVKFGELQSSVFEDSRRPLGSGLVGCRGAGVPGGGQATGRSLLRIQRFFVGYFSQREPGPQGPDSSFA